MSEIRATTISDLAGTGPATLTGQYAAKAWVNLNGTGTIALRDSFNVSSTTDLGVGQYRFSFSSAMLNANYCGHISTEENGLSPTVGINNSGSGIAAGSCDVETHIYNGGSFDAQYVLFSLLGDLA